VAKSTGVDISDVLPPADQEEIERAYQGVKNKYLRACPDCGRQTVGPSWHEKDLTTMAREVGLEKSILGSYLIPTHQIHSTPVKLLRRLERTPDAILFNSEPRRAEADSAIAGAHLCVTEILTEHNRHFGLGHATLAQELEADLLRAWGNRPDLKIV
jgi:hypothetical protein